MTSSLPEFSGHLVQLQLIELKIGFLIGAEIQVVVAKPAPAPTASAAAEQDDFARIFSGMTE